MSACRSCGAAITWATTKKGKRIPIDAAPNSKGNIQLIEGADGPIAIYVDPHQLPGLGEDRFVSHFATCPDKAAWRKAER